MNSNNSENSSSISVISEDKELFRYLKSVLSKYGMVRYFSNFDEDTVADITLLDVDNVGIGPLQRIKDKTFAIILTREKGSRYLIESMSFGAFDCLLLPCDKEGIEKTVSKAVGIKEEIQKDSKEFSKNPESAGVTCAIVGNSPILQEVCKLIGQMGRVDVPVLITGESGTGKDLVAESIWKVSTRWEKPFITINCAAIPEHLLEAELFGYEKGAFTGATTSRVGKFEEADGGVIFMDEIGDMSLSLQAKVLRVLQNGTFQRLGGNKEIKVDIRIIAATNKDLKKLVREGRFREDLYFRINVVNVELPPLRERKEDIPMLSECFIRRYSSQMGKEIKGVTSKFLNKLLEYNWPGNVRELENTIRKAIAFSKVPYLTSYDIDLNNLITKDEYTEKISIEKSIRAKIKNLTSSQKGNIYNTVIKEVEAALLKEAMESVRGNKSQASRLLGINRITLIRKLKELGIEK